MNFVIILVGLCKASALGENISSVSNKLFFPKISQSLISAKYADYLSDFGPGYLFPSLNLSFLLYRMKEVGLDNI